MRIPLILSQQIGFTTIGLVLGIFIVTLLLVVTAAYRGRWIVSKKRAAK